MKNATNSKANLDRALQRFAGDFAQANDLRGRWQTPSLKERLASGRNGFSGGIRVLAPAKPRGIDMA